MAMPDSVSRRRFLEAAAALAGVTLLGCSSETHESEGQTPAGPSPSGPQASKNADGTLTLAGFGTLAATQGVAFVLPDGLPAILFKDKKGNYGAVSATCTHAGCTVEWRPQDATPLACPCHNSKFNTDGNPVGGPAKRPLDHYGVKISGETAILTRT